MKGIGLDAPTPRKVMRFCAAQFDVPVDRLTGGGGRDDYTVKVRHLTWWVMGQVLRLGPSAIAREARVRHGAVSYGIAVARSLVGSRDPHGQTAAAIVEHLRDVYASQAPER